MNNTQIEQRIINPPSGLAILIILIALSLLSIAAFVYGLAMGNILILRSSLGIRMLLTFFRMEINDPVSM